MNTEKCHCNQSHLSHKTDNHKCIRFNKDLKNDPNWAKYISCPLCVDIELFNDKVQEMKDHFNIFVYEMDLLIHELDFIQNNKGEKKNEHS